MHSLRPRTHTHMAIDPSAAPQAHSFALLNVSATSVQLCSAIAAQQPLPPVTPVKLNVADKLPSSIMTQSQHAQTRLAARMPEAMQEDRSDPAYTPIRHIEYILNSFI
jgi:hypothetical protein